MSESEHFAEQISVPGGGLINLSGLMSTISILHPR